MGANRYDGIDEHAVRLICKKAAALVGVAGFQTYDYQDIQQELAIHWVEKLKQYDPERGSMRTFINVVIKSKALNLIKARSPDKNSKKKKIAPWCCTCSVNDIVRNYQGEPVERISMFTGEDDMYRILRPPDRSPDERRDLSCDLRNIANEWPPEVVDLCRNLVTHENISEVSRLLNIPRTTLFERIKKIRGRLEEAGFKDYLQKKTRHFSFCVGRYKNRHHQIPFPKQSCGRYWRFSRPGEATNEPFNEQCMGTDTNNGARSLRHGGTLCPPERRWGQHRRGVLLRALFA